MTIISSLPYLQKVNVVEVQDIRLGEISSLLYHLFMYRTASLDRDFVRFRFSH